IAPELDHGALHSEAEPEIWGERGPGEAGGGDLPLNAPMTESARDHDAVHLVERAQIAGLERFGGDPLDVDPQVVMDPGMTQRFGDTDVGIGGREILPHHPDAQATGATLCWVGLLLNSSDASTNGTRVTWT